MANINFDTVAVVTTESICSLLHIEGMNDIHAANVKIVSGTVNDQCDLLKFASISGTMQVSHLRVETSTFHRLLSLTDVSRAVISNSDFYHTLPH